LFPETAVAQPPRNNCLKGLFVWRMGFRREVAVSALPQRNNWTSCHETYNISAIFRVAMYGDGHLL